MRHRPGDKHLLEQRSGRQEQRGGRLEQRGGLLERRGGMLEQRAGLLEQRGCLLEERGGLLERRGGLLEQRGGLLERRDVLLETSLITQLSPLSDLVRAPPRRRCPARGPRVPSWPTARRRSTNSKTARSRRHSAQPAWLRR